MPLIILTGYPCSGLTHRANQLATLLSETQESLFASGALPPTNPRYKIHVVATHDTSHPRTVYDNARTEKETRGVAYGRARRLLGKDSFVILDGMNYIKGYRYQLWCEAKALGTTCCVVHVGTPIDQCVANNDARIRRQEERAGQTESAPAPTDTNPEDTEPYPPALLNNLIFRYEEPNMASRWDKPLFVVPFSDPQPPIADIWSALTGIAHPSSTPEEPILPLQSTQPDAPQATGAPSIAPSTATHAGGLRRPRTKIKPHQATAMPLATDSTALYSMEKRTSAIVSAIREFTLQTPSAEAALAQSDAADGIVISVPEVETTVFLPAHVALSGSTDELAGAGGILALPRLQRLRRQWIALNRSVITVNNNAGRNGIAGDQIGDAFVRFLNAEIGGAE